jgi:hypothetical protein
MSSTPSHDSSDWIRRLNAGCDVFRFSAARVKLPVSATVRKSCSQRMSMIPTGALRRARTAAGRRRATAVAASRC